MAGHFPRPNWSIRTRILVPYLALIVAMVSLTGLATGSWAAARARRDCIERGRGIAETLGRSQFPLTDAILQQLKGLGGAEFALVDAGGSIRASTLGDGLPADPALALPFGRPDWRPGSSDVSFERVWACRGIEYRVASLARPPAVGSGGPQRLLILLPEPTLQAAAREAERAVLVLSLAGAGLAVLLAVWVGRTLSRPLSAILQAIRQIARGDLHPTGLPRRRDEIGELADGVGQMAHWLRRLHEEQVQTERLRLIRQLSGGMAHELRNPLTAARMTVQLFIERNGDRDTEALRIALSELTRMERQVRRFLQIARPEPPRFAVTDLGPILERAVTSLAALAAHRGVRLMAEDFAGLPRVRIDPEQIGQVLVNLAVNALDVVDPGGQVRVAARFSEAGWVALDVEDDGPGVPAADQPRLFQPFFTTKPEGVGLGLALCAALVREHGGTIEYGRAGSWTRFLVSLPLVMIEPSSCLGDDDGPRADPG